MNTRVAWVVLIALTVLIVVLAVMLFVLPTPATAPTIPPSSTSTSGLPENDDALEMSVTIQ